MLSTFLSALLIAGTAGPASVDLESDARNVLGVSDLALTEVQIDGEVGQPLEGVLLIDGVPMQFSLTPHSVHSDDFRLLAVGFDGRQHEVDPGPSVTYRGTMHDLSEVVMAASWIDGGLFARLRFADGTDWWIQPLRPHLDSDLHALYHNDDIVAVHHFCGTDLMPQPFANGDHNQSFERNGGVAAAGNVAELGCDADFEYFSDYGSVAATSARIDSVISTMNLQYESEVDISHTITTTLVRTSSSQPYTSTDAGTLLNQFRNEWNANQGGIVRDVAHLFTGKEINSGTIGIAWVGVICNSSYGYGLVQSDFNNNFACATDLSAHELGHNWNAGHCSCTSHTMNPYITCSNTFNPSATIPTIESFRDSRTCLDGDGGGGGDPTTVHVASISPSTRGVGRGRKVGRVVVSIVNDLGQPVSGANVTITFSGDYSETLSGTTDLTGNVTLETSGTKKGRVRYTVCVDSVVASLPYAPGDNVETCDSN